MVEEAVGEKPEDLSKNMEKSQKIKKNRIVVLQSAKCVVI